MKMLNQLIANLPVAAHDSLIAADQQPVMQLPESDQAAHSCPAQAQTDNAYSRQDVSSLVQGIWEQFKSDTRFPFDNLGSRYNITAFDNFADVARAYDQPTIALQCCRCKLEVSLSLFL